MSSLTDKQIKFLDDLGKGPKGITELIDDHHLTWRELKGWRAEPAFAAALAEVFEWLDFVREVEVRVGATEALRKQRLMVDNRDMYLSARQRQVGDGLWKKARQLDSKFPRRWGQVGTIREISPVHPDHLHEAHTIVKRMEELRRAALEAKAARKQLPAPVEITVAVEVTEAAEAGVAPGANDGKERE